ncbi:MAG TPA: molybdopterin cofactor-binding domain-containing protein, partial [Candidatus Dormibacteraeota bacterium]|nr:molybdopterin cofactor-binding domain-containing protein [Candidatus Dormibacteraeota bacterium]
MAARSARAGEVRRLEDRRLITGAGIYTDDVRVEGCLHAVFVRSPLAHARITGIDLAEARRVPGVVGVFTAADLEFRSDTARPRLCAGEVRFVGDAIAVAVGETREAAADAAALVAVDFDPLPVIVDATAALEPDAPLVDADKGDNLALDFELGDEGALEGAEVVVRGRFVNQRLAAVPLEGNAVLASPDLAGGLRMWVSTQAPFNVRRQVAEAIGVEEERVRVTAGDVGGAFGAKLMVYPEPSVIAAIALRLGRPVRWAEHRSENMVAMTHGRGHVQ